jgi:hypothetical protein
MRYTKKSAGAPTVVNLLRPTLGSSKVLEKKGGLGLPGPSGTEDRSAPILCARVASSD